MEESYKLHQLGKTPGLDGEGWSAGSPGPQPACGAAEGEEGGCTSNQCPSLWSLKQSRRAGAGGFLPRRGGSQALSLRLDPVPEHKVCQQPQGKEENAQDQEVHVEFCFLHIQLLQDDLWVLEWTLVI